MAVENLEFSSTDETKRFIQFMKSLSEKEQIGLNLMIEGLRLLAEKQKKRC